MYSVPKLSEWSAAALDAAVAELRTALSAEAGRVSGDKGLREFHDRWLGRRNGILTQINEEWLKAAPAEAKREVGQRVNELRTLVRETYARKTAEVELTQDADSILKTGKGTSVETDQQWVADLAKRQELVLRAQGVDVSLPGIRRPLGAEHPVIRTMNEICGVFRAMGYSVAEGPEIESDYYNFEALNFPPEHPARDTQDTIFLAGQEAKPARERLLLRTHTSPVQIRSMERQKPPVRVVIPGKIHRHDAPDASHSPMFHQVEGLAVDTNITFSDLKGTLDHAMKALFGSSVKTRFQPSFFPFTEPSAEVAFSCIFCGGKGCRTCKQSGWIELLGCGMVDPNVFEFVRENGYDPAKVSGFAFGMGVDRVAMLKYGIDDIQLLFQGDVRFLEQFG